MSKVRDRDSKNTWTPKYEGEKSMTRTGHYGGENSRKKAMTTEHRPESSHSSSLELPNIHGINKPSPHPEEWTLPHEWNIEKRELFDNWKMDVQNQISNIANNLVASLNKHPREDLEQFDYSDAIRNNELKKRISVKERQAGTSLNYGLARVAFPDKY